MNSFRVCFILPIVLVLAQGLSLGDRHQNASNIMEKGPGKWPNSTTFTFGGRSYVLPGPPLEWAAAKRPCLDFRMQLVAIDTQEKSDAISKAIGDSVDEFWTSGTDQGKEGSFIWDSTGQALNFTNWASGEPNNNYGNEHCIKIISDSHTWNDNACWDIERYICESVE